MYQLKFIHELENLKLEPRVVIQDEFPGFGFFNGFEIVENQFCTLEVEIWCVAESGQLKHVDHIFNRQVLDQRFGACLLELRHQEYVRQGEEMNPVLAQVFLAAPETMGIFVILEGGWNLFSKVNILYIFTLKIN